ncbi:DUF2946 family protein [Methylocystis parvus]|uniref:DUF2946 family protein n=1 Tax=Methylocystis parvus TaxID=134 RepID=UPI003C745CAB
MSQLRLIGVRMRVAIAIVTVWALMFGASLTSAANANATDAGLKSAAAANGGLFACFKRHMTQRADATSDKAAPEGDHASKHRCPCCLAAAAVAAVLPSRVAAGVASVPAPRPVFYLVENSDAPENLSSRSAHGARAPPALA